MGKGSGTIGFRYLMSIHMGLGRGANEIAEIRVGDVTLIDTPICIFEEGQLVRFNRPDLFGGDEKEGGIDGAAYFYNGAQDQELQPALSIDGKTLPSIAASLGGDVPNFRGVVTMWFDGMVCALNPYPKEWSFRIRRTTADWFGGTCWYQAKATITMESNGKTIKAMNGAHILYEINTNPEWGRGMPALLLDENSYVRAANQLCEEGFGLCLPWFRQETLKEFIPVIIDHIGGVQYVDRETGKLTLRLIRNDYVFEDLPIFTPSTGLLRLDDDDASGEETAYNEIVIKGFDPTTKEDISVRWQNGAAIRSLGEIISNTIEYKGIPTRALLARVAAREAMNQLPLRRMNAAFDRRAWKIAPGMPFRIQWPAKGIADMVVRAGEITDDTLRSGEITMSIIEDVFAMPLNSYIEPSPPIWIAPNFEAVAPPESRLLEINYRDLYRVTTPADRSALTEGVSIVAMVAKAPPGVSVQGYDIATHVGADPYVNYARGAFTGWLTLETAIAPLDTSLTVLDVNRASFGLEFVPGMAVLIDDEQLEFTTFDEVTGIAAIKRGVADTIPAAHLADSTIWLVDDEMVSDGREYVDGEIVYGKALTRTSTDLLTEAEGEERTIEVNQRLGRPYPPGNVKVDAVSSYLVTGEHPEPVLTWSHRDRLVQADMLVDHTAGSVGPEAGTTYVVRVYDGLDGVTLLRTIDVGAVDTWTYDAALQGVDGNPTTVFFELESVRDTLASQFKYRFFVVIAGGWGYSWGNNWTGA